MNQLRFTTITAESDKFLNLRNQSIKKETKQHSDTGPTRPAGIQTDINGLLDLCCM